MRIRIFTRAIAALSLFAVVGLVAALAIAWPNLARAQSLGGPMLYDLTVTAGGTAQRLVPAFYSTDYFYEVHVDNSVSQVTVAGTPGGDATVTAAQLVNLPAVGATRVNVVVSLTAHGTTTTRTYTVLVIRKGTMATDRAALMALYNSAGGADWTNNTNWGSTEPLDSWYGISVPSHVGRVIDLELEGNNLVGTLPDALGNLDQMEWLLLGSNQLRGTIPASLGDLANLRELYLNNNELTGSIPDLGSLTILDRLYLGGNKLTGSIPDLSRQTRLVYLYLGGNKLTGEIPGSLNALIKLRELYLGDNQLDGTIPDLSSLTKLQELSLGGNELSGALPTTLGSLTSLETLDIHSNNFDGPIPDLSSLTSLQFVYLWDNHLSGAIPATLDSLTNLEQLYLNRNELSGPIPDLGSLTSLTHLYLNHNQLSGTVPSSLDSLTSLVELSLSYNQLDGTIPTLSNLTSLRYLYLAHNALSGAIPDLSSLTSLEGLWLDNNDLTGGIPGWLNSLTSLQELSLSSNRLDGTIPNLSLLANLTKLSLRNNELTGGIPAWLGQLTHLEHLYLSANQLSGDFPQELGNLDDLKVTRFASNPLLTGCVPLGLRYLLTADDYPDPEPNPELRSLDIPAQDFIPKDSDGDGDFDDLEDVPGLHLPFCMLSALAFSDVILAPAFASGTAAYTASVANTVESTTVTATLANSSDRLSIRKGTASYTSGAAVPLAVGSNEITITVTPTDGTPTLTYTVTVFREGLDRATLIALYNSTGGASWTTKTNWNSAGSLDLWFGVITNGSGSVTALDLPGNNLSGTLPAALGTLTNLTTLDLSDNGLSGMLPDLSSLTSLTALNLGDNQLSGTIPDWLSSLTGLTTLNLGDNRLTGPIPDALGILTQLDVLYLDDNQLSGPIPDALSDLTQLDVTRFAGNALTGCVPNGLRYLVTDLLVDSPPAHDFIAVDANMDGDTADDGDTPGLGLPFCTLESLTLSGVTLEPAFASDTVVYTPSADHAVTSTTVTATAYNSSDTIAITKGADSYTSGDSVPLDAGSNVITIEITPADDTPTHTYTVTVTRAANAPPAFDDGATASRGVAENTAADMPIGDEVGATDDDSDTLTYSLDATGAESFDIDESSGQLRTKVALDHETKASYTVTASVRDSKDDNGDADEVTDDTITVTILVADLNEAPVFTPIEPNLHNVDENTTAGENIGDAVAASDDDGDTLTYSLDVASRATFDIVSTTGQLQTRAALDYETGTNSYTVTVTATDPSGADDTIMVTITVEDVDEPGMVTLSSPQPIVGQEVTATLTDPDGSPADITWFWERSRNQSTWIISKSVSNAFVTYPYLVEDADLDFYLRARVSYTDGEGSDKSASLVSTNRVQPAPVDPNEWPQFPSTETGARNVDENTMADVNIGAPVAATDAESDPLTYSLDPAGALSFDIVVTTGQLQTKAALDFETTPSYSVIVTATDTAGGTDTIRVTITVNNVDEPATVTLSSPQPLVAIPLTATLDEPDQIRGSVIWSWERSPNGTSDWTPISGATSDIYTPVADDVGNYLRATASYYDEEVQGQNAQAISASGVGMAPGRNKPVLGEHPTATRSVARNTPAGRSIGAPFTATDADNDALIYSLGGPDGAGFDIDASSGQLLTKAVLTGILRTIYKVFVSVSDGKDDQGVLETPPMIDTTTEVTINVTTPRSRSRSGGGSSGGGGDGRRATPTPSPTPTPIPTPTGPQFSGEIAAEPSVTGTVVPEGTTLGLNGGGDEPGGVYVNFPPTAVALPVHVSVSVSNDAPDDVTAPSGTTLLPLTIDISPETPLTLGTPLTIEINPTPEQLEAAGGDLNNLAVGVVTPNGIVVLPAQVLHGRLVVTIDHLSTFVLLAITDPGPVLTQPPPGDASSMGPLLQWTQPPRTTWFQVQVIPFNEDGPGINLVIGDGALVQAAQYQVLGPNFGSADPNYVLLPDMTYLWRVRTSTVLTNPTEADWSAWAVSSFKTPPASSSTITRVAPPLYGEVRTFTPTLTWANSNPAVFYYEVQLSKDFEFGPNAFLYSEYVHGGASTPPNSYVVPEAFPLEAGAIYYWRVRPRIQGDGDPLPWSRTYVFQAPG